MKSQKVFVVSAILATLAARDVEYQLNGETPIKDVLTAADKAKVRELVFNGFKEGQIQMSEQAKGKYLSDDVKLKVYVNGLVNNWIKKNPEFNGGQTYKPANPGSRAGSQDEQIKALRQLKKQTNDAKALAQIDEAITARLAEIKPQAVVEINAEALPEHLRHLVK